MTTFVVEGYAKVAGIPTDGLPCAAYLESRFGGVTPSLGSPFPDMSAADGGPVNSASAFGSTGKYQITVPTAANYWIACWDPNNSTVIAWSGPKMATPHTSLQGWTSSSFTFYSAKQTTVAAGSNSVTLPIAGGVLHVGSSAGFPGSGFLIIGTLNTVLGYTGVGSGTFTGCTGGTGTLLTSQNVSQGYQNGNNRRLIIVNVSCTVSSNTDSATLIAYTTIDGALGQVSQVGIPETHDGSGAFIANFQTTFPVDPLGFYGIYADANGAGTVSLITTVVNTVDF